MKVKRLEYDTRAALASLLGRARNNAGTVSSRCARVVNLPSRHCGHISYVTRHPGLLRAADAAIVAFDLTLFFSEAACKFYVTLSRFFSRV